jgi:threonine dehydrogenase-like Zn-dependent dehydrogenase
VKNIIGQVYSIEELIPDVLEGRIDPGRVFDWVGNLEKVPDGYRVMNDHKAIKALIELLKKEEP